MSQSVSGDPTGREYKRAHPEQAREYNRRANAKRPDRDRSNYAPCVRCGGPRAKRTSKSGLCRSCWRESR